MIEIRRRDLASVYKRNGAYLVILWPNEVTMEHPSANTFDCASSLVVARRIARRMCRDVELKPTRWIVRADDHLVLIGYVPWRPGKFVTDLRNERTWEQLKIDDM
jgi:hypothetical protein